MNENYEITETEENDILQHSAKALPDSPTRSGMTASQIKQYLYGFIPIMIKCLNEKLKYITYGKEIREVNWGSFSGRGTFDWNRTTEEDNKTKFDPCGSYYGIDKTTISVNGETFTFNYWILHGFYIPYGEYKTVYIQVLIGSGGVFTRNAEVPNEEVQIYTRKIERDTSSSWSDWEKFATLSEIVDLSTLLSTKIEGDILTHNTSEDAHSGIVETLNAKDTELGNSIEALQSGKVNKENGKTLSTNDFNNGYKSKLDNLDSALSEKLTKDDISISTSNTSGLTYKIKIKDKYLDINIPKDQFLKNASYNSENHKLKFVFETSSGEETVYVDLADLADIYTAGDGLSLDNGVFNIDSSIARTEALSGYTLKSDFQDMINSTENAIEAKENKRNIVENSAEAIELESGKEYNCGIRTSLILNLPNTINSCFECIVNFKSGAVIPTFDSDARIIYTQDDTLDGSFYPIANRIYEINIKNVMGTLIAIVNVTECEVSV